MSAPKPAYRIIEALQLAEMRAAEIGEAPDPERQLAFFHSLCAGSDPKERFNCHDSVMGYVWEHMADSAWLEPLFLKLQGMLEIDERRAKHYLEIPGALAKYSALPPESALQTAGAQGLFRMHPSNLEYLFAQGLADPALLMEESIAGMAPRIALYGKFRFDTFCLAANRAMEKRGNAIGAAAARALARAMEQIDETEFGGPIDLDHAACPDNAEAGRLAAEALVESALPASRFESDAYFIRAMEAGLFSDRKRQLLSKISNSDPILFGIAIGYFGPEEACDAIADRRLQARAQELALERAAPPVPGRARQKL